MFSFQSLPIVPILFQPSVSCSVCAKPNDCDFRFCQRCGYQRQKRVSQASPHLKAPVNLSVINARKQCLVARQRSTPYQKQKSALEVEFMDFLGLTSQRDMCTAIPDDVVDFLIWRTVLVKRWYIVIRVRSLEREVIRPVRALNAWRMVRLTLPLGN